MICPNCRDNENEGTKVIDTTHDSRGGIRRRRECKKCHTRFSTYERPILASPIIVKEDGTRDEFDREKLKRGIARACVKLPVATAEIQRLVGEIESKLQQMEKSEVSSRVVGDLVMAGLKELHEIAYIRFALVYLGLDDLQSIRQEADGLIEN